MAVLGNLAEIKQNTDLCPYKSVIGIHGNACSH